MSKEWLADKKGQLKSATVFVNENGNEAVEVSLSVLNKLFELAEQKLIYDKHNYQLMKENAKIMEQYKRYRERLEYLLEEAKDHKRKGLRIQHWALIKDLEKALEGEE